MLLLFISKGQEYYYSLELKLNDDKFHYSNSEDELDKILQKC